MDYIRNFFHSVPFLSHLNNVEAEYFHKAGGFTLVKRGQLVDVKKLNALHIVIDGIFEIESISNRDIVYLSAGSFFGFMPFIDNKKKGNVRALVDSRVFIITEDELYKLFLLSHKALRGYLKTIENMNFDISDVGRQYFSLQGKVITVYSQKTGTGKTMLSSLLGLSLSGEKTVILDLSSHGNSVFDLFKQRLTVPLSEKDKGDNAAESLIRDRIVKFSDNLHLLNISFSARVKVDPSILGPLLFLLSREYKYIIADLSDDDHDLRNKVFEQTDFIFILTNMKDDPDVIGPVLDVNLKEGQRVYYVRNNNFSDEKGLFYGGLMLNRIENYSPEAGIEMLDEFISEGAMDTFKEAVAGDSKALVIQSAQHESILLASFFLELNRGNKSFSYIYSSSYTYFMLCMYMLCDDYQLLYNNFKKFFSPEQFNKNMEITFPENYVYRSGRIRKYTSELAGTKRAEMFRSLPLASINSGGEQRIFSTGLLNELMSASFVSEPLFEPARICNTDCFSGFPDNSVIPSDLFRTEASEIFSLSFINRGKMTFKDERYNNFFINHMESSAKHKTIRPDYIDQSRKLILEVSENEFKFDRISENTMKTSQMIIARIL